MTYTNYIMVRITTQFDKINYKNVLKKKYDRIVISPGPGNPNQSGNCKN